jgi:cytochrome c-type biogenesis protein CcmF
MAVFGLFGLLLAFAGVAVSIACLVAGDIMRRRGRRDAGETLVWGGHVAVVVTCVCLTFCCAILLYCFVSGDDSIEYVVNGRSREVGVLGMLYKVAGLWEGREGSLLFWAWLISLFNTVVAVRNMKRVDRLDSMALLVSQLVLAGFVGIMLFSEANTPFVATPESYFDSSGNLTGNALYLGMNALLEHWAMAVHPPTLFIGYAGLTIPFAFAIAAIVCNDSGDAWVRASQRYAMVSWFFLSVGIGLGAIWAYVVLGWGGYWGWDPVENASLLPWLIGLALLHSFTVYRQRGAFKRWSVMCACLAFASVITGTFITRSGLVESVHAFEGDPVSLVLFGALIGLSLLAGVAGLALRWKKFGPKRSSDEEIESFASREAAYYFNNVALLAFAAVVCYLTVSSALPSWLPFGGESVAGGAYSAIARPLGMVYLLLLAVCPLLSWGTTNRDEFMKRAKVPAICAAALFVVLMVYAVTYLFPSYDAMLAQNSAAAQTLAEAGPAPYYKGLTVFGLLVASVLLFNMLVTIVRNTAAWSKRHEVNPVAGFFKMAGAHVSLYGGYLAHLGMAVILVGLIGSSMYVTEHAGYVAYDEDSDTVAADFRVQDYSLRYTGNSVVPDEAALRIDYIVEYDVYRGDAYIGHVAPSLQLNAMTQQTKSNAAVLHFPTEDLFVVYNGVNTDGDFSMDVRVNPQISTLWAGFVVLLLGIALAAFGKRKPRRSAADRDAKAAGETAAVAGTAGELPEAAKADKAE